MDFTLPPEAERFRRLVRDFIEAEILPLEADRSSWDAHENIAAAPLALARAKAKAAGLWAPQVPRERGGMGLTMVAQAAFYEEANRSIFGPVCLNCAAPDDGNMRVLSQAATPRQQDRWLDPVVSGEVRSAFAMTEPAPGGGSDPAMIRTRAERRGGRWVVHGRKWFITGAAEAAHFILIARVSDDPRKGLGAFLFHRDQPGWRVVRRIPIMGPEEHGGHCELAFDGLEIADDDVLLGPGDGLRLTQMRLGPARLTHCMRWLGLAKRCLEIAAEYAEARTGFGVRLAERETVQVAIGRCAAAIEVGRLLVMKAAWKLDAGEFARKEISLAKNHVADTLHLCADTAVQVNGARGYSKDTVAEWIYRYARQARLVDGASEVHAMVLAGCHRREGNGFWSWGHAA
ncbi:acyl-CoA dehydrogenase family protein [Falsiroseomonas sp. HW251]|uniref:acyl-CoA dehydrogenase family protein n=1 Tax=Falsiroseomonas sp. HW251 TaxID=3390998 RepID=UPI003D31303B